MQILRDYKKKQIETNRKHKIKNSYNITMVNKIITNKIRANKTKKYRRKRLRGGNDNVNKLGSIGLQMGQNLLDYIVNTFARIVGVDPNQSIDNTMIDVSKKIDILDKALDTPEGKRLLQNIKELIKITTNEIISPAIKDISEEVSNRSEKIIHNGTQAALNTLEEIPGPGTLLGIVRTMTNLINMAKEGTELGGIVLGRSKEVAQKLQTTKAQIDTMVNGLTNLVNNKVEEGVNKLGTITDNVTKNIANQSTDISRTINSGLNTNPNMNGPNNNTNPVTNLNTVGNIVGGRLSVSLSDFIKPTKTQYGGGITKKRHIFSRSMTKTY